MNKDVTNIIKDSTSTFLNIAQMTQYRMKYLQDRDKESKEKMVKYTVLSCVGILSLLTIGIAGLIESRKDDNRLLEYNH
jgi:NADH:ubiquinone oxidoreductase subunit 2 (subunit N)